MIQNPFDFDVIQTWHVDEQAKTTEQSLILNSTACVGIDGTTNKPSNDAIHPISHSITSHEKNDFD